MVEKVVSHGLWLERNFPNPELKIEQKDKGKETVERKVTFTSSYDPSLPIVLGSLESVSKVPQGVTPQLCAENFWTSVMRFPVALFRRHRWKVFFTQRRRSVRCHFYCQGWKAQFHVMQRPVSRHWRLDVLEGAIDQFALVSSAEPVVFVHPHPFRCIRAALCKEVCEN